MGKYIGIVGSFASIIALFFISTDNGYIRMAVFVAGIIFSVIALGFEIKAFFKTRPLKFDKQGNTDYMNQILKKEGEYIVFAGELSWVNNDEILNTMKSKGEKLSLCANNTASHLEELKMAGVNVYAFDDFSPRTHFTVIRAGTANEKIAITSVLDNHRGEKRLVYEFSLSDNFMSNWIINAAKDLFELAKIANERNNSNVH